MKKVIANLLVASFILRFGSIAAAPDVNDGVVSQVQKNEVAPILPNESNSAPEDLSIDTDKASRLRERTLRDRTENDGLKGSRADTTEYTLDPSSVQMVVELDPNGYGFISRNHRMTISSEFDLILRGRGIFHYDYRFFNYFSFGVLAGIDLSDMSLSYKFRTQLSKPLPWQFSILGGVSGKWRLTEWYMRSAFFLEPSFLFGPMWQNLASQRTHHWRLRPGLFAGFETVFDSGFSLITRLGVEKAFDFGDPNAYSELAEALLIVGLGFSI